MIVSKAVNMAKIMNVPVLGLVENMSYVTCPDCGRQIRIFGESKAEEAAQKHGIGTYVSLPLVPEYAGKCDEGNVEDIKEPALDPVADMLEKL